jgi:hypothetical protein
LPANGFVQFQLPFRFYPFGHSYVGGSFKQMESEYWIWGSNEQKMPFLLSNLLARLWTCNVSKGTTSSGDELLNFALIRFD